MRGCWLLPPYLCCPIDPFHSTTITTVRPCNNSPPVRRHVARSRLAHVRHRSPVIMIHDHESICFQSGNPSFGRQPPPRFASVSHRYDGRVGRAIGDGHSMNVRGHQTRTPSNFCMRFSLLRWEAGVDCRYGQGWPQKCSINAAWGG